MLEKPKKPTKLDDAYIVASIQVLAERRNLKASGAIKALIEELYAFIPTLQPNQVPPPIPSSEANTVLQALQSDDFDLNSVYKTISESKNVSNFVAILIYIYVYNNFREEFDLYIEVIMRKNKEHFVSAVRGFLGKEDSNNNDSVIPYKGSYLFFQPFHRNPHEQINVCRLSIGDEHLDSMYGVRFEHITREFNSLDATRFTDYPAEYLGKIVPNGVGGFIFLTGGESGMIAIAIDHSHCQPNPESKRDYVHSFRGTMLPAVGHGHPSSAWPFYAVRVHAADNDTNPRILDRSDIDRRHPLMRDVIRELDRGAVVWSHDLVKPRV